MLWKEETRKGERGGERERGRQKDEEREREEEMWGRIYGGWKMRKRETEGRSEGR